MKTLLDLQRRPGDPVRAEDYNALLEWLRAVEVRGGPNVMVARTPQGTFITAKPAALPVQGAFEVSVSADGDKQAATVSRGLLEGIEPVMKAGDKDVPISGDATKDPPAEAPALALPKPATAEGGIYLEAELDKTTWLITRAEVKFYPLPLPSPEPWRARKLLAIVRKAGDAWEKCFQAVHFNMGHYAYGRRPNGRARHLWFAR